MQASLFPGVSALLRSPSGKEISIRDIEVMLHHQRAIVGGSPSATNQDCLSVAEELLVIQRLKQHEDYLHTSGLSNALASGTDGFGALLTPETSTWDLGVFQENLRRGVEQIVRCIRQSRDVPERTNFDSSNESGPSRTPSQYARQTEQVNRMVNVLQDAYFSLARQSSAPSAQDQSSSPLFQETAGSHLNQLPLSRNNPQETQQGYALNAMQRNVPSTFPFNHDQMRSATSSRVLDFRELSNQPTTNRSISHGPSTTPGLDTSSDAEPTSMSSEERAAFRTQQLTEALKPKSSTREESAPGLKWTRSLTRRKSRRKLNRAISNPHLVSTTQNLENAIDLVNLPQSPTPVTALKGVTQTPRTVNPNYETRKIASSNGSFNAMSSPQLQSSTRYQSSGSGSLPPDVRESSQSSQSHLDSTHVDAGLINTPTFTNQVHNFPPSDMTKASGSGFVSPKAPTRHQAEASQSYSEQPTSQSSSMINTGTPNETPHRLVDGYATAQMSPSSKVGSPENTETKQSTNSIRKSLLINMGIQIPSPNVHPASLPSQTSPIAGAQLDTLPTVGSPNGSHTMQSSTSPQLAPADVQSANTSPSGLLYALQPSNFVSSPKDSVISTRRQFGEASPRVDSGAMTSSPGIPLPYSPRMGASNESSPAMPITTHVPGLGAIQSPTFATSSEDRVSPNTSFFSTKSVIEYSSPSPKLTGLGDRDKLASQTGSSDSYETSKVRDSTAGDVITFPTEDELDEERSDANTEMAHEAIATQPILSTPKKRLTPLASQSNVNQSPMGLNTSTSYGDSVYDMYMSPAKTTDEDGLFKKTGILSLRDDDPRASHFVRMSSKFDKPIGVDSRSSLRQGRSDNPIWQVVAGLHDRTSMYSEMDRESKRFSDLSNLSRREQPTRPLSDHSNYTEQEEAEEADRALFKSARSVQPLMPVFADFDSIALPNDQPTPHLSPERKQSTFSSNTDALSEPSIPSHAARSSTSTVEKAEVPVQVVYYNDDELPEIMERIAQGNSSARIEFRRRSAYVGEPTSATGTSEPATPLSDPTSSSHAEEAEDFAKPEENNQIAKVEQSILSMLRPTFNSLRNFS
ncbi:hypothetical protein MYAM1_003749 [Malassezia yamatoensis]|uniref:Uncharacterized protein n=1 Tax=Malassezia yamatoensis TaxID=253288 RepID=A0AAJ5YXD0_9BASI|nr:hypothetical protein MYAM1_003749 [Malassezia yamatoensis]